MDLRDYQKEGVEHIKNGHTLLCDEPGLGKTVQAIFGAIAFEKNGLYLVVCPKHLRHQWVGEIEEKTGYETRIIDTHTIDSVDFSKLPKPLWIITHYEVLSNHQIKFRYPFDVVIADEAHRLKNRKTKRTIEFTRLIARRKVALTATEMEKSPVELFPLLRWFNTEITGAVDFDYISFWKWATKRFHQTTKTFFGKRIIEWGQVKNNLLQEELKPLYLRRTKEQVLPELPPFHEQSIFVPLSPPQEKDYKMVEESDDIEVGDDIILNVLAKITKLQQISSFVRKSSSKVEWIKEWVDDNPDSNVLIFTRFRETARLIKKDIPKATLIMGGTGNIQEAYKSRVVVAVISAIGEGISLPHIDYTIFVETMYSSIQMTQAKQRFHRLTNEGQQKYVIYLLSSEIDKIIYETGGNKERMIERFRGGLK